MHITVPDAVALLFFVLLCALIALGGPEGADEKENDSD
jgi:hypothetical protein